MLCIAALAAAALRRPVAAAPAARRFVARARPLDAHAVRAAGPPAAPARRMTAARVALLRRCQGESPDARETA